MLRKEGELLGFLMNRQSKFFSFILHLTNEILILIEKNYYYHFVTGIVTVFSSRHVSVVNITKRYHIIMVFSLFTY